MLDAIDLHILDVLQQDSHISNQDLADRVALSPSPCLRRVKRLHDEGYIYKQVALVNPHKIGLELTAWAFVSLSDHATTTMKNFEKHIKSYNEVTQCSLIAGQSADYVLKVNVPDMTHYHDFLIKKLTRINGVNSVQSSFVLTDIINKTALPLDHLMSY